MLTTFVNTLVSAEHEARSTERSNVGDGSRHREVDTRAGTLDVAIPALRTGS